MSVLKIVRKRKISRRLRKNLHITILSLFGGEIILEVFRPMRSGYLIVTDRQTTYIYKLSILTYKALHTGQPCYLADLLHLYRPSRALRSTNSHLLAVPSCPRSSFASRAFCLSSPNNWNSLPLNIRSSDSPATFQSRLKSHLFASAYHV